jgi:hypothetical protein
LSGLNKWGDALSSEPSKYADWFRRLPIFVLIAVVLFYGLQLVSIAASKRFWYDEIFTLSIAPLDIGKPMWEAMTIGYEFNPPLTYLVVKWSEAVFGRGEVMSRLPFILAGMSSVALLFEYGRRLRDDWLGLWMSILLVFTGAHVYFTEARAYALILLGFAIVLVGWRLRVEGGGSKALVLISIGLAMVTLSHVWAVALVSVFVLAEFVRWYELKRADTGVVVATAFGCLPFVMYPALREANDHIVNANGAFHSSLEYCYAHYLSLSYVAIAAVCVPVAIVKILRGEVWKSAAWKLRLSEKALLVFVFTLPVGIYGVTWLLGMTFLARYGIGVALIISILGGMLIDFVVGQSKAYRSYALGLLLLIFPIFTGFKKVEVEASHKDFFSEELAQDEQELPIVLGNGYQFIHAHYYAPHYVNKRLLHVVDADLSLKYIDSNNVDLAVWSGSPFLGVSENLITFQEFLSLEGGFWFVDYDGWIRQTPEMQRANRRLVSQSPDVYRVNLQAAD